MSKLQLKPGHKVVYPAHGVGEVKGIETQNRKFSLALIFSVQKSYIQTLEGLLRESEAKMKFQENFPGNSFLELKSEAKAKSKADPMLKSMLFGFPNPRRKTFGGGQNSPYYGGMKVCPKGCIVE